MGVCYFEMFGPTQPLLESIKKRIKLKIKGEIWGGGARKGKNSIPNIFSKNSIFLATEWTRGK